MKKLISILLAVLMFVPLAACESDKAQEEGKSEATADVESAEQTETETISAETDIADGTGGEDTEDPIDEGLFNITLEETVVVDNEECLIKILGAEYNEYFGFSMKVEIENKSADKNYHFDIIPAAINGIHVSASISNTLSPGRKSTKSIDFITDDLDKLGIEYYSEVMLNFIVYDWDSYDNEYIVDEAVTVYPYGEENAVRYEREDVENDIPLTDNENFEASVLGFEYDEESGSYNVQMYVKNKSDVTLVFMAKDVYLNGKYFEIGYSEIIEPGIISCTPMCWLSKYLQNSNIDPQAIGEIKFRLVAYDVDDMRGDGIYSESFTLNP